MLLPLLLLAVSPPPSPASPPASERVEVFAEALAGSNAIGTTGGGALGGRVLAYRRLSLGGRCALSSGSFAFFTPNGGFEERGERLACFFDAGPQLELGPVTARATISVGGALDRLGGIAPVLVSGAGIGAGLPIDDALSIVGDVRIENALGAKGIAGGLVVGVGLSWSPP